MNTMTDMQKLRSTLKAEVAEYDIELRRLSGEYLGSLSGLLSAARDERCRGYGVVHRRAR